MFRKRPVSQIADSRNEKEREGNFDLLRVICAVGVVAVHVGSKWVGTYLETGVGSSGLVAAYICDILPRFAVPCFMMLTGAFVLANKKNGDFRYFYRKAVTRVVIPTIIFSVFYTILNGATSGSLKGFVGALIKLLAGKPHGHMWYMYMLIGVYLLIPVVITVKEKVGERTFARVAWIFLALSVISYWTSTYELAWDVGLSFRYCSYIMVGYELRRWAQSRKNNMMGSLLITAGIAVGVGLMACVCLHNSGHSPKVISSLARVEGLDPLPALSAVLVFTGFSLLKIRNRFRGLSRLTLYVYLIHASVWYFWLWPIVLDGGLEQGDSILVVGCVALVTILSFVLAWLYDRAWGGCAKKFHFPA